MKPMNAFAACLLLFVCVLSATAEWPNSAVRQAPVIHAGSPSSVPGEYIVVVEPEVDLGGYMAVRKLPVWYSRVLIFLLSWTNFVENATRHSDSWLSFVYRDLQDWKLSGILCSVNQE